MLQYIISAIIVIVLFIAASVISRVTSNENTFLEKNPPVKFHQLVLYIFTDKTDIFDRIATPILESFWTRLYQFGVYVFGSLLIITTSYIGYISWSVSQLDIGQTKATEPTNALAIPGVNDFLPLHEAVAIVIALGFAVVVHEVGHAIASRVHNYPVNETGLAFLGGIIPIAAYVYIPKKKLYSAPRFEAASIFAAGVLNNILLASLSYVILISLGGDPTAVTISLYQLQMPNLGLLYGVLYWSIFLNISVALVNVLPIRGLDGGLFVRCLISKRISNITTAIILYFVVLLYISPFF